MKPYLMRKKKFFNDDDKIIHVHRRIPQEPIDEQVRGREISRDKKKTELMSVQDLNYFLLLHRPDVSFHPQI
jgi:hypothetical protein